MDGFFKFIYLFSGLFSAAVTVRQISSISLQLQQQRHTRRARKRGGGGEGWREDECGRQEKKRWLCHLHLNRISRRQRQEEGLQKRG